MLREGVLGTLPPQLFFYVGIKELCFDYDISPETAETGMEFHGIEKNSEPIEQF